MKKRLARLSQGLFFLLAAPAAASAQGHESPAPVVKAAMARLAWLEGEWRGEGWRLRPDGVTETFNVHEIVEPRLDGLVMIVEGRGWRDGADGVRVEGHHAFGVFSYDAFAKTYRFDAFVKEGYQTRATPEVGDGVYRWSHPAGPGAEMRYGAELTPDGEWVETGARCVDETCAQTFEMRLGKVDSQ